MRPFYIETKINDVLKYKSRRMKERRRSEKRRLESLLRISQYRADSVQEFLDFALSEAIT